jgi:hypothetical protein
MRQRDRLLVLSGVLGGLALGLVVMDGLLLYSLTLAHVGTFNLVTAKLGIGVTGLLVVASIVIRSRVIPPKPPSFWNRRSKTL